MTATAPQDMQEILKQRCEKHRCPYDIMRAIVTVESHWDPHAVRYEKNYKYLFYPRKYAVLLNIPYTTEKILQQMSWGLGQVMGGTAREMGYNGPLPRLSDPAIGLEYACIYFHKRCNQYYTLKEKISAYNAGSPRFTEDGAYVNQDYVDKVIKEMGL